MVSWTLLGRAPALAVLGVACGGSAEGAKQVDPAGSAVASSASAASAAPTTTTTTTTTATPTPPASTTTTARACTKIGCSDAFTVRLKGRPFDPKGWKVEAEVDGKVATCAFDWSATSTTATCSEGLRMAFHEPPLEDGATAIVTLDGAPSRIGFTVKRNNKPVEPQRFYDPTYETVEPNGAGCPPSCRQATGPFVLK